MSISSQLPNEGSVTDSGALLTDTLLMVVLTLSDGSWKNAQKLVLTCKLYYTPVLLHYGSEVLALYLVCCVHFEVIRHIGVHAHNTNFHVKHGIHGCVRTYKIYSFKKHVYRHH